MSMASFTVRVELHDGDSDDYDVLHGVLKTKGFTNTIVGDSGAKYRLPPAEYNYVGSVTRQDVAGMAKAAANVTGLKSAVLVTESAGRYWDGLKSA
jgi:hypothetical protein